MLRFPVVILWHVLICCLIVAPVSTLFVVSGTQMSQADVQKVLFVCMRGKSRQICPQLRSGVRAPDGWIEDKIAGSKQGRVVYVPKGKTFEVAPFVITALTQANKAKTPIETLNQRDQDAFKQSNKDSSVSALAPIINTKLGGPVKLFKMQAPGAKVRGSLITARFEDRDADGAVYTVELTLMANTDRLLSEARPKFEGMIRGY